MSADRRFLIATRPADETEAIKQHVSARPGHVLREAGVLCTRMLLDWYRHEWEATKNILAVFDAYQLLREVKLPVPEWVCEGLDAAADDVLDTGRLAPKHGRKRHAKSLKDFWLAWHVSESQRLNPGERILEDSCARVGKRTGHTPEHVKNCYYELRDALSSENAYSTDFR